MTNPKRHAVLGTAGHIDHGKTSLVNALTGVECDTHKEEKKRGITINLGFTHLESESVSLSIIDVPGHADFIKTMVAGASGIDLFLLVIAADSGIMPQTIEHLQILKVLGVESGVVAITKTDLADDDIRYLLTEEIVELHEEFPFLQNAPTVEVSSKSGEGVEELKILLADKAVSIERDRKSEIFRMYIDRLFTVKGVGTIVAGSVLGGAVSIESAIKISPGNIDAKIRRMERHGEEVTSAKASDRISLNLTGVKREQLTRGLQITTTNLQETTQFDAEITLFNKLATPKTHWQGVLIIGSCELQAKIHTISTVHSTHSTADRKLLVQVTLEKPTAVQPNDRFVIRNSSDDRSVGGGRVIDPFPLNHRKRSEKLIESISAIADGDISRLLLKELACSEEPVYIKSIAQKINITEESFLKQLKPVLPKSVVLSKIGGSSVAYLKENYKKWESRVIPFLEKYEEEHQLNRGVTTGNVVGLLGLKQGDVTLALIKNILINIKKSDLIIQKDELWFLREKSSDGGESSTKKLIETIDNYILQSGEHPAKHQEVIKRFSRDFKVTEIKEVVNHLVSTGSVFIVSETCIHKTVIAKYRDILIEQIKRSNNGITLPEFRDNIEQGRKFAELIITLLENNGEIEVNKGDLRYYLV
jgi:selenocysteine-specific elongation factor